MDFFGITMYGPVNYFRDVLKEDYQEPMNKEEVLPMMKKVVENSTCPKSTERPDVTVIRYIDCYVGKGNGFAYGSFQRFNRMKRKGVIKPVGPADIYRIPPATSVEFGWWNCDPALANQSWYRTYPRYPQPISPNTRILDIVKMNNKYASLF